MPSATAQSSSNPTAVSYSQALESQLKLASAIQESSIGNHHRNALPPSQTNQGGGSQISQVSVLPPRHPSSVLATKKQLNGAPPVGARLPTPGVNSRSARFGNDFLSHQSTANIGGTTFSGARDQINLHSNDVSAVTSPMKKNNSLSIKQTGSSLTDFPSDKQTPANSIELAQKMMTNNQNTSRDSALGKLFRGASTAGGVSSASDSTVATKAAPNYVQA